MKIKEQKVEAQEVLRIIDARLEMVTMQYNYAKADDRKVLAEVMAETKWQLAELKMQFVDHLIEKLENPETGSET